MFRWRSGGVKRYCRCARDLRRVRHGRRLRPRLGQPGKYEAELGYGGAQPWKAHK
jgi:hypothetical protein